MHDGKAFRMLTIIDEFTGECFGIPVARRIRNEDVMHILADLFVSRGQPDFIRSDNGSEFTATAIRKWLKNIGVNTAYIEPGSPWKN